MKSNEIKEQAQAMMKRLHAEDIPAIVLIMFDEHSSINGVTHYNKLPSSYKNLAMIVNAFATIQDPNAQGALDYMLGAAANFAGMIMAQEQQQQEVQDIEDGKITTN